MDCILKYSVPASICLKCANEFIDVVNSYSIVTNKTCREMYVDQDRLNIIEYIYSQYTELWDKAFCEGIFFNLNIDILIKLYKFLYL